MKKLLLVLFISVSATSYGQSWAAPGATWYYNLYTMFGPGYERIRNIGDTVINNNQYNKIEVYQEWYDMLIQSSGSAYRPMEFTRADSGVVYYYRDGSEYVLYDFNAVSGDSWLLRSQLTGFSCDTGSVSVDSLSSMIINNDTLLKIYTTPVSPIGLGFNQPVVERIGGLSNLFPFILCISDIPQGDGLRCYSDSTGWTYINPMWQYSCDYVMNVPEQTQQGSFSVFQDAQSNTLTLSGTQIENGVVIQIYDSSGQMVEEYSVQTSGSAIVSVAGLVSGIYYVSVSNETVYGSKPFVIAR